MNNFVDFYFVIVLSEKFLVIKGIVEKKNITFIDL